MVIHPFESKCKAEFITDETISACACVCVRVCVCMCEYERENDFYGAVNTVWICVHIGFSLIMLKCRGVLKNNP